MNIDLSKKPDGATHYTRIADGDYWYRVYDGVWDYWSGMVWVAVKQPAHFVHALEPDHKPWTGEGLPPVGTVCEVKIEHEWEEATVIAHHREMAITFRFSHEYEAHMYDPVDESHIRPIRTPEQIAADEREAGITQMRELAGSLNTYPFAELWDAGYRKQPAP